MTETDVASSVENAYAQQQQLASNNQDNRQQPQPRPGASSPGLRDIRLISHRTITLALSRVFPHAGARGGVVVVQVAACLPSHAPALWHLQFNAMMKRQSMWTARTSQPATCMHACMHSYIHICMHACIHTYKHTYIHKASIKERESVVTSRTRAHARMRATR